MIQSPQRQGACVAIAGVALVCSVLLPNAGSVESPDFISADSTAGVTESEVAELEATEVREAETSLGIEIGGDTDPLRPRTLRQRRLLQVARSLPDKDAALQVGERLVFSVRYGPIHAGEAVLHIKDVAVVGGDSCYHIVSTATSNKFFSTFFRVRDRVESYFDVDFLFSRRFEKHLREGGYEADVLVEMDQGNHFAIYDNGNVYEMPPGAHDVLSAFYYVRAMSLEPGQQVDLESHTDGKNYPIKVMVHRRERVTVPAGTFDCLAVEPTLRTPGLFRHEGSLTVWLTDDERKIPIMMKSKVMIGSISAVLIDVQGRSDWPTASSSGRVMVEARRG